MGQSDDYFVPATKSQRDTLFAKMKEAGYMWDTEKKELKKISQEHPLTPDECIKPADKVKAMSHSYITPNPEFFQWIYNRLVDVHNENPNMDYMCSLRERIKDMRRPTTWCEEDEARLKSCLNILQPITPFGNTETETKNTKWLKSLKQRIGE